jgi:hypothetical protein
MGSSNTKKKTWTMGTGGEKIGPKRCCWCLLGHRSVFVVPFHLFVANKRCRQKHDDGDNDPDPAPSQDNRHNNNTTTSSEGLGVNKKGGL